MDDTLEKADRPGLRGRAAWLAPVFFVRLLGALVVAAPLSIEVGSMLSRWPRGDAILFDAGGEVLVEVARRLGASGPALAVGAGASIAVSALLGLGPLATLLVAVAHRPGPSRAFLAQAGAAVGTLALLWGLATFAQVLGGGLLLFGLRRAIEAQSWAAPRADLALLCAAGAVALGVLGVGVVHDVARVVAVDERRGVYMSLARALDVVRARPARVAMAYLSRGALTLAALAGATILASRLGVSTLPRVLVGAVVHQGSLVLAVVLRASWLAAAMRHAREVAAS